MLTKDSIAQSMMQIDSRVSCIHDELEALHEMKDELRSQFELIEGCYPICTFYENN